MVRVEALEKIKEEKPFDEDILEEIKKKRTNTTNKEWDEIMEGAQSYCTEHETYKQIFEEKKDFFYNLYKSGYVPKSFYHKFCVLKDN